MPRPDNDALADPGSFKLTWGKFAGRRMRDATDEWLFHFRGMGSKDFNAAVNAYLLQRLHACATARVPYGKRYRNEELQATRESWMLWCLDQDFLRQKVGSRRFRKSLR
jgi:uncharacterized protein (DUF3820 family)